jgi:Major Facilitator Superfamily
MGRFSPGTAGPVPIRQRGVSVVVFLLLGGVVADRLPRHLVMVGSSVLAGVSQAAAAALLLSGTAHVTVLAALQVVNGACSAFTIPSTSAVLPQTVPGDLLRQANALARVGDSRRCGVLLRGHRAVRRRAGRPGQLGRSPKFAPSAPATPRPQPRTHRAVAHPRERGVIAG